MQKISALLKNLGTLLLLLLAFPLNLIIVTLALLWGRFSSLGKPKVTAANPQTVLLTGGKMTKALQLARSFFQAGHRVILVETDKYWLSGHRFSRAVNRFYTVPDPTKDSAGYIQKISDLIKQEKVNIFVPVSSPVGSYYDALVGEVIEDYCKVVHLSSSLTKMLDDKFAFCEQAHALGLSSPQVFYITDPQEIVSFNFADRGCKYIFKSIHYNSVSRLHIPLLPFAGMAEYVQNLEISPEKPWVMQQFIKGQEYCTHSTVKNGKVLLHCCSRSSAFQINYQNVDKPEILAWVEKFVKKLNLTGQISFDFVQDEAGILYPIECNPRTHSAITMFYNHPLLAASYTEEDLVEAPITPLKDSKPTYWLYHEIWRLTEVRSLSDLRTWLETITQGTDALLQLEDPLPFLTVPHWQITLLLLHNLSRLKGWLRIDFNIGKLVELGGD
jgi:predicted ATP-grasp superfamily ATP-dependent carboligase